MLTLGVALPLNYSTGDPDAHTWCSSPWRQMLTLGVN